MIHRHFLWLSPIRLIIVLSFDSYISWQIVLPSLLNVCLHFLLYIYIFNWYFMHHYHTYEGHINKNGYDLQALSFYTWLWYIMAYCLSFLWNVFLQIFLYIYIFNLYSMHHYHTHWSHINKHGYDSETFFLVIINKKNNGPSNWLLHIVCPPLLNVCLHFFLYIHLQLIYYASLPLTLRPY